MRSFCFALAALIGATSVGACAGSPVEAQSVGSTADGSGETTVASTTSNSASASTTSPSGSAGDPTGVSTSEASGDPSGNSTDDATSESSASRSDASSSTQAGETSSDGSASGDGSDSSAGGDGGGCLGDPLPEIAPVQCSMSDVTQAELEIENGCAFSIEVYWVNYACEEQSYQVISSADSWSVSSFDTHPWRIRSVDTGDLILEIPPLRGDTIVVVQ